LTLSTATQLRKVWQILRWSGEKKKIAKYPSFQNIPILCVSF
jgi:hypothetical protein